MYVCGMCVGVRREGKSKREMGERDRSKRTLLILMVH